MAKKRIAATRRIADAKARDSILIQAAVFEIGAGCFALERAFQLFDEEGLGLAVHFHQHSALETFFAPFGRAFFWAWNGNPAFLRDEFHGLRKLALLHVHHEVVDVAALAAAEAVEDLFDRRNRERGGFFLMKRTKAAVVFTGLLQSDVFANDPHNVGLLFYSLGDGSCFCHVSRLTAYCSRFYRLRRLSSRTSHVRGS